MNIEKVLTVYRQERNAEIAIESELDLIWSRLKGMEGMESVWYVSKQVSILEARLVVRGGLLAIEVPQVGYKVIGFELNGKMKLLERVPADRRKLTREQCSDLEGLVERWKELHRVIEVYADSLPRCSAIEAYLVEAGVK